MQLSPPIGVSAVALQTAENESWAGVLGSFFPYADSSQRERIIAAYDVIVDPEMRCRAQLDILDKVEGAQADDVPQSVGPTRGRHRLWSIVGAVMCAGTSAPIPQWTRSVRRVCRCQPFPYH
jgi:hypothetical protein